MLGADTSSLCAEKPFHPCAADRIAVARRLRPYHGMANHGSTAEPFCVMDCSLIRCATGRVCSNLRELLEAMRTASDAVLEHHMMRCALEDHFELLRVSQRFSPLVLDGPGRQRAGGATGRRRSLPATVDGDALRARWSTWSKIGSGAWNAVPWCRPGLELHLIESRLIAYDTGERIVTAAALLEAIERMSRRSLFFHVHEARRRTAGQTDDFSLWLENARQPSVVGDGLARDRFLLPESEPTSRGPERGLSALHRGSSAPWQGAPHEALGPLRRDRRPPGSGAAPPPGRAAGRQADRARQFHAQRRRRGRNPGLDGPADAGVGHQRPLGGRSPRPPDFYRVTKAFHNGLQGLPVSLRKSDFDLHYEVNRENAAAAEPGGGHRFHPRSAARLPAAVHAAGPGGPLGLALPHRRLAAQSGDLEILGDGHCPLQCGNLLDGRLCPAAGVPDVPHPAFHRSPLRQELRHSRGRAAGDAGPAGHRPGPPTVVAGLAV